jgi:hypothetical protein
VASWSPSRSNFSVGSASFREALQGVESFLGDLARFLRVRHVNRRVPHAPVCGDRLSGPDRAGLACSLIADGDHQVEPRRTGRAELVPGLAARAIRGHALLLEELQDKRIHLARAMTAGAERTESSLAELVQ